MTDDEMEQVFNLGLGMLAVVPGDAADRALDVVRSAGHDAGPSARSPTAADMPTWGDRCQGRVGTRNSSRRDGHSVPMGYPPWNTSQATLNARFGARTNRVGRTKWGRPRIAEAPNA